MKFFLSLTFLLTTLLIHAQRDTLFYTYNSIPVASFSECRTYGVLKYVSPDSVQVIETRFRKGGSVLSRTLYLDFENKVRHGQQMFWNDSMRLALTKDYYKDTLQGYVKHYSRSGQLESEQAFIEGVLVHDTTFIETEINKWGETGLGVAEYMPIFPGCENIVNDAKRRQCSNDAIFKAIVSNVHYPEKSRDLGIEGTVVCRFVIGEEGNVVDLKVIDGMPDGEELMMEAIRSVMDLPVMISGTQRGEKVRVQYTIPVKFHLENEGYEPLRSNTLYNVDNLTPSMQRKFRDRGVYTQDVDRMPIWKGCELKGTEETEDDCTEWRIEQYVIENVIYPLSLKKKKPSKVLVVNFMVTEKGEVEELKILEHLNTKSYPEMREEAKRVVESMPDFIPAQRKGEAVPFKLSVAVKFKY